ncbi:MAG: DEAD/DEAH box helicase family protein [Cocleimonas sp.]|nr:DEAD/DEAH box helicase family protein [Cocleimonas sp.]
MNINDEYFQQANEIEPEENQNIEPVISQGNDLDPPAWLNDAPPMHDEYFQQANEMHGTRAKGEKTINDGHVTTLNKRYLGESILVASEKSKYLMVKSGMGTGKTTAMKKIIASLTSDACILFMTPRKKLNYSLAEDLGLFYYEDVKNEQDKERKEVMARRMVVTPQSLGAILKEFPDIHYEYIVMDESKSIAELMVSTATTDKVDTLKALRQACALSKSVIMMDAHIDEQVRVLMGQIAGNETAHYLLNENKSWTGFKATLVVGSKYTDRRDAINKLQEDAVGMGRVIYIASSSKAYCDSRELVLKELFPKLKILNVTAKSTNEAKEILSRPETIKNWDIVIGSPSIAVGVSFDIENHINEVYGVFPNAEKTGGSDDAIQSLARPRKPTGKHWTIILDDNKKLYSHAVKYPQDIVESVGNRAIRAKFIAGNSDIGVTSDETRVINLFSVCHHAKINDKNNFNKNFSARLKEMGITVSELSYDVVGQNDNSQELTKEAKEKAENKTIEIKTTSDRITEVEANRIGALKRFRPSEITEKQSNSHERYIFESKFNINCDDLSDHDLSVYLDHDNQGTVKKLIRREIVLHADKHFMKRYIKARVAGLGEEEAFKVEIISDKLNLPLTKKILSYAIPYIDGKEYSHKSLKRSSLIQFIARNYKEVVALRVITLPAQWKSKPALLMNNLLKSMGYKPRSKRGRDGKKLIYIYTCSKNSNIEKLYETRLDNGKNWITSTNDLMDLYEEIETMLPTQALSSTDTGRLQMPAVHIRFALKNLAKISEDKLIEVANIYKQKYDMMDAENDGINAPKDANEWLENQVKNCIKTASLYLMQKRVS